MPSEIIIPSYLRMSNIGHDTKFFRREFPQGICTSAVGYERMVASLNAMKRNTGDPLEIVLNNKQAVRFMILNKWTANYECGIPFHFSYQPEQIMMKNDYLAFNYHVHAANNAAACYDFYSKLHIEMHGTLKVSTSQQGKYLSDFGPVLICHWREEFDLLCATVSTRKR